jgi:hypothetical protein
MPRDDDDDERDDRDDDRRDERGDRDDDRDKRDRADDDAVTDVQVKPMPLRLTGAIIASIFWGGLLLYGSCVSFSQSVLRVVAAHNAQFGFGRFGDFGEGFFGTMAASQFFMFLLAAALLAAGILLMMRKGFARWMAMGVPGAMVLLDLFTAVICLIITSGTFLAQHNFDILINIVFNLGVGGCNAYLLLNKDVVKALK